MEIKGQTEGEIRLHSKDATFIGVDAYPADELSDAVSNTTRVSYTALLLSRPEVFENLPQWKDTDSLVERLEVLETILELVSVEGGLPVFCWHTHIQKGAAYKLGAHLVADMINTTDKVSIVLKKNSTVRFRFGDKEFKELQAVSMMAFACAITSLAVGAIKVISTERFAAVQTPLVQLLIDNVSGNAKWNKKLVLYMLENTKLGAIIASTVKGSAIVEKFGLETPKSNEIEAGEEIEGTNNIPLMIATDWFTRMSSEYEVIQHSGIDDLDATKTIILKIFEKLKDSGGYFAQEMPTIEPENAATDTQSVS